jgi:predicted Zn-dependent protease
VDWQEALKLAPDNLVARIGLAWSLYRLHDYSAAMATLRSLLNATAGAEPQFLYGASLLNLQQPIEAMPYLRAAVSRDPNFQPARAALGQALLQTGNLNEAIPLLEQSAGTDQDGAVHFQLFRAYQLAGRKADAERALAAYRRVRASLGGAR